MKGSDILKKATELIGADRADQHGDMWTNHENIAQLWTAYLWQKLGEDRITSADAANMMELLKVARRKLGAINVDDYTDGAGYAAVAYECKSNEKKS
tara:strand:+ start:48 stop:338 length:291 start_codon:yes stop_codon:yes gene_type:complete